MSRSKLFTPKPSITRSYAMRAAESDAMCLNPPTHAEIPVFDCPTTNAGGGFPLRMAKSTAPDTTPPSRRPISSDSDHGKY